LLEGLNRAELYEQIAKEEQDKLEMVIPVGSELLN